MNDDELAAVIAALQIAMQQPKENNDEQQSAWRLAARREAIDV